MTWQFDLATNIGGRAEQQDRVEVLTMPDRTDEHLVILADGMGGQQQGALAAQTVIDTARREFPRLDGSDPRQFLTGLCLDAHAAIRKTGLQNNTNPASTCTALYLKGDEAYWIHAGDSRLYHFETGNLVSRTCDHTVAELLTDGNDAIPADNRLYMCLGGQNDLEPEFGATAVGDKDWFLLCSDGFWSQMTEAELTEDPSNPKARQTTASDLVAMAARRAGSGGDNVSLVLVRARQSPAKSAWRRLFQPALGIGR